VHPPGRLRFLDAPTLAAAASFPPDRHRRDDVRSSTLVRPRIIAYAREGYRDY
jgi:spermidine synthase